MRHVFPALNIIFNGDLNLLPVESMMLEKTGVLSGYDGVLQGRGNLPDRHEHVHLAIRSAVRQGLQTAFCLDCGRWLIHPAKQEKTQGNAAVKGNRHDDKNPYDACEDRTSAWFNPAPKAAFSVRPLTRIGELRVFESPS